MKRKVAIALILFSSIAQAGKLNLDARIDGQGQSYNSDAVIAGLGRDNFRYLLKTARLDYNSNINDRTSVRGRLILNTTQGAVNTRDSMNGTVDLFYINHQLVDSFDITAGKFSSDMGGMEHQTTSPDVYLFSTAYTGMPSTLDTLTKTIFAAQTGKALPAAWSWSTNTGTVRYYTGVKGTYKFAGQEIALHSADLTADWLVGPNSNQSRTMTGVVFKGSLMDKAIQPILSYHEGFLAGAPSSSNDAKVQYAAIGVRFNISTNDIIEADYISNYFVSRTVLTSGEVKDDSIASGLVGYMRSFENIVAKIKGETSQVRAGGEALFDIVGLGAAVEWKPVKDEIFRYHAAYNGRDYTPKSGNRLHSDEFLVGLRASADILK